MTRADADTLTAHLARVAVARQSAHAHGEAFAARLLQGGTMTTPHPRAKRARKTRDEYIVQGHYGQGWEDVTAEDTRKEARARLREYDENETGYAHRLIKRRIKLEVTQ